MGTEERNPGASLPAGVVTFLMTDVVGSTPLWERAPLVMDATLQRHDALVEQTVNLHGGHLLLHRGEGDSTFSVFESATAAVAAANEIQRRLGDEQWHESTPIAVRMGIHSGEVVIRNHDYYGRTVNRAARVRGLADGGQIYVTGAVAGLVNDDVPDGTELRFVRVEVLRGIDHPEEIYELVDPARPIPVAPADVVASDRPFPEAIVADTPDVFAGRAELLVQLDAIRAASVGALNVVLLAGEPGSGKSSLAAVAATRAHADGWLVVAAASDEGARVPYQAVREVLTQCVDAAPRWLLGEHASEHGGEVGRLTPRLAIRLGALGLSDPIEIDTTRRLLAEAVIDLLRRMTEIWPIVMVLDDLQWADRSTLQMLEAIVAAQVPGLLVLGTYRAGHADRGEFAGWLERILRRSGVSNIEVQGLGEDEMFEFLEGVAGHELGDAGRGIAALLAVETQGNALFMIEILRHMVESGLLATGADGH